MTRKRDEQWRMPELERLGEEFRAAEMAELAADRPPWWRRTGSWWRRGVAGLLGALAAVVGILELVAPAGANSPVNRAPAAAERAGSVRFSATQVITVGGRQVTSVRESGAIDFMTRAFASTLVVGESRGRLERRRVGGTLYFRRVRGGLAPARAKWSAVGVAPSSLASFAPPGGYTLIDPQVVFRVMSVARAPVTLVGREPLDGIETTHYRLSTSLSAFLADEGGGRVLSGSSPQRVGATLNVWLDSYGRPVRVRSTFLGTGRERKAAMTTEVSFGSYGLPANVSPPNPKEVMRTRSGASQGVPGDPARNIERLLFPGS